MLKGYEGLIEELARKYPETREQQKAIPLWLKFVTESKAAFQNERAPAEFSAQLQELSSALKVADGLLKKPGIAGALLASEHKRFYKGNTSPDRDEYEKLEDRARNDIAAISRVHALAKLAQKERRGKKTASRNSRPWLVILTIGALKIWGGSKRGPRFLEFYNGLCELAGVNTVANQGTLDKRIKAARKQFPVAKSEVLFASKDPLT
jgi:hypothetical protein